MSGASRDILPSCVSPLHYELKLSPSLQTFDFEGEVTIHLKVLQDTDTIVVNTKELEISKASLESTQVKVLDWKENPELEQLEFRLDGTVKAGEKCALKVNFKGSINDKLLGFYRSAYQYNNQTKYLAVTQFEAIDARRAFPCFDEPKLKVTFDIQLTVDSHLVALSNMAVVSETASQGNKKTVQFGRTPIMSTYLVAFAVGEFEYIEVFTEKVHQGKNIRCRVYTTQGEAAKGQLALNYAVNALDYYSEIFGIDYQLEKLDLLAVPDHQVGAMENWGLVTFKTSYLLLDHKPSIQNQQTLAYLITHELAHQWFGNLVTMESWSELWLNEGFATWVGYLCTHFLYPEWQVWTMFLIGDMQTAQILDSLQSSHPIVTPINKLREVRQTFDIISYSKGASLILMLSSFLGTEVFLKGIRRYLKKHQYGNANTCDLWDALKEESQVDVARLMKCWILEKGFPLVTVTETTNEIQLTQNHYLAISEGISDSLIWWIPITLISEFNSTPKHFILDQRQMSLPKPEGYYKINVDQTAFIHTLYTSENIDRLGRAILKNQLSVNDRVGLLTDTATLARTGRVKTSDLLNLLRYFKNEDEYLVCLQMTIWVQALLSLCYQEPQPILDGLDKLQRDIFSPIVKKLGWEVKANESQLVQKLRALAIQYSGASGDVQVIEKCKSLWHLFQQGNKNAIHPDLKQAIYDTVVMHDNDVFHSLLNVYRTQTSEDHKLAALSALGCVRNKERIQELLNFSLSKETRASDILYVFMSVANNPKGRNLLWHFFKDNWSTFQERYQDTIAILDRCIRLSAGGSTQEMLNDVESFFAEKDTGSFTNALEQVKENTRVNIKWINAARKDISQWLGRHI